MSLPSLTPEDTAGDGEDRPRSAADLPTDLSSVSAVEARRNEWEIDVLSELMPDLREFLAEIEEDAVSAILLQRSALTAAGSPITLGGVTSKWRQVVVVKAVRVLSSKMGIPTSGQDFDLFAKGMKQRLLNSPITDSLLSTVQELAREAVRGELTPAALRARFAEALGDDPHWSDWLRRIVGQEVTTNYSFAILNELAAQGAQYKVWWAHLDDRTRPTHRAAHGQRVLLGQRFSVGGALLQVPGDPDAPAEEIANCRCVITGSSARAIDQE